MARRAPINRKLATCDECLKTISYDIKLSMIRVWPFAVTRSEAQARVDATLGLKAATLVVESAM